MAATGKTPILLYGSTTATNQPSAGNLTNSSDGCEIAINVADKNLFFKDATNTVNTVPIRQSNASSDGWLSSTDWSTFNSKQPAGTYVTSVTGTAPVVSSGGTTPAISMAAATGSVNGYLTSTDWTTFNNKAPAVIYTTNYIPYGQGTTTPNQSANFTFASGVLHISNSGATPYINLTDGTGFINLGIDTATSNRVFYNTNTFHSFLVGSGATEAQRIHASGGVSIGNTTDPGAGNLSVKNIYYKNSVSAGSSGAPVSEIGLQYGSSSTSAGAALKFWNIYQNTSRSWLSVACANDSGTVNDYLTVHPYNGIYVSGNLYPNTDNANSCGQSSNRWTVVYATTGTINTSDGNQKQQIRELLEAELAVAKRCKSLIRAFKFNEAVDSKGNAARIHFGVIAQHIAEAFAAEGLNAEEYGVFCKDIVYKIGKESVMPDNDGKYPEEAVATEQLGVRYEELFAFIIAAL